MKPLVMPRTLVLFAAVLACLSAAPLFATPISDKYAQLGGTSGFLGSPTIPESTTPDGIGKYRHYQGGSIYWHPQTGAHEVHGLIRQRWANLGWELSYLGYPMTDEINTFDGAGRVSKFQGGELIWRSATNAVSEVKAADLVVDLPFPVGQAWYVIQANAATASDSHGGPWAYCWDFMLAGKPQSQSNGKPFAAIANTTIVHVDQDFGSGPSSAGNVIIQRLGEGRYASYLHLRKGSYSTHFGAGGGGLGFLPQALPWQNRPKPQSGAVLAEMGDTGANAGAYHLHFCVTTKPDRPQFKPFESVPVAFRNYSYSPTSGLNWIKVATGVPRQGQWLRRDASQGQGAPQVNNSASTINYGTVKGQVTVAGPGKPSGAGTLTIAVSTAWGEPLRSTTVTVPANAPNGPWSYTINTVPAYNNLIVAVGYSGPWSVATGGGLIGGQSGAFTLAPNGTATQNLQLKATVIH